MLLLAAAILPYVCWCADSPSFSIAERGPHHRVWQKETVVETDAGTRTNVASYTELATGLHYWQNDEWLESQDLIEPAVGGAAAVQGPHAAWFSSSLAAGAISVTTPDGKFMQSHPLAVAYADGAGTVFIARLHEVEGWLWSDTEVLYPGAFGVLGDIRYRYDKSRPVLNAPGAAGNIFHFAAVKTNGVTYLFSNDEGAHGLHRWRIEP